MLADTGIQQLAIKLRQPACRHGLSLCGVPLAQPTAEQQLEQYGNESRRGPITCHISEIEQRVTVIKALKIKEITRKIERWPHPVITTDTIDGLWVHRQQLALYLPTRLLIQA